MLDPHPQPQQEDAPTADAHVGSERTPAQEAQEGREPDRYEVWSIASSVEAILLDRVGRENAITGPEIVAEVNRRVWPEGDREMLLSSVRRRVQETISELRAAGEPIGSDSQRGYWRMADHERPAEALWDSIARLKGIVATIKHLDAALAARLQTALDFGEAA